MENVLYTLYRRQFEEGWNWRPGGGGASFILFIFPSKNQKLGKKKKKTIKKKKKKTVELQSTIYPPTTPTSSSSKFSSAQLPLPLQIPHDPRPRRFGLYHPILTYSPPNPLHQPPSENGKMGRGEKITGP